jgi:CO/xanthine dehydrogenase FAD-binding subunit
MLTLQSSRGTRWLPVADFFLAPGKSACADDELLTQISLPVQPGHTVGVYLKISRNKAADLAICGVAVSMTAQAQTPSGFSYQIVVSGANPVPFQSNPACGMLGEQFPVFQRFQEAAHMTAEAVNPVGDIRSSIAYRKAMVYELTLQALQSSWKQLKVRRYE